MTTSVNNNFSRVVRWLILLLSLEKPIVGAHPTLYAYEIIKTNMALHGYFCARSRLALNISLALRGNVREKINKKPEGLFTWRWGTPGRWGNPLWWVTRLFTPAHFNLMEFLRSFLRRHLAGKPVIASPNVGCFLRLVTFMKRLFWTLKWRSEKSLGCVALVRPRVFRHKIRHYDVTMRCFVTKNAS